MITMTVPNTADKLSRTGWEDVTLYSPSKSEDTVPSFDLATTGDGKKTVMTSLSFSGLPIPDPSGAPEPAPFAGDATIISNLYNPIRTSEVTTQSADSATIHTGDNMVATTLSSNGVSNPSSSTGPMSAEFTGGATIMSPPFILSGIVIMGMGLM